MKYGTGHFDPQLPLDALAVIVTSCQRGSRPVTIRNGDLPSYSQALSHSAVTPSTSHNTALTQGFVAAASRNPFLAGRMTLDVQAPIRQRDVFDSDYQRSGGNRYDWIPFNFFLV